VTNDSAGKAHLTPGQVIDNKYEVKGVVGVGAFSVVYDAFDLKLGRRVAVKTLDGRYGDVSKRFEHEINVIKQLEHPGIARLYDFGYFAHGAAYIVMAFIEGKDLQSHLKSVRRLELHDANQIAMQILDALVEAHQKGVIHCDLKPENIILTQVGARENVVMVLDFGIAALTGEKGQQSAPAPGGGLVGTPCYMAPEQILQQGVGPQTDLYAMGLILYELVTGQRAVKGETSQDILEAQIKKTLYIPDELMDTELGPIIKRAVAKKPAQRYQTAMEMYKDLKLASSLSLSSPQWGKLELGKPAANLLGEPGALLGNHDEDLGSGGMFAAPIGLQGTGVGDLSADEGLTGSVALKPKNEGWKAEEPRTPRRLKPGELKKKGTAKSNFEDEDEVEMEAERAPRRGASSQVAPMTRSRTGDIDFGAGDMDSSGLEVEASAPRYSGEAAAPVVERKLVTPKAIKQGGGAKMGLVAALVLVIAIVGMLAYFLVIKKKAAKTGGAAQEVAGEEADEGLSEQELDALRLVAREVRKSAASSIRGANFETLVSYRVISAPSGAEVWSKDFLACKKAPCILTFKANPTGIIVLKLNGFLDKPVPLASQSPEGGTLLVELDAASAPNP